MRSRTLSGLSSFFACSLGFNGSRWPSAHWPSPLGGFTGFAEPAAVLLGAGSVWVIRWPLHGGAGVRTRVSPVAVRRRRSGGQLKVQVDRSTTSRQTATAADALEVDVPPDHERYSGG